MATKRKESFAQALKEIMQTKSFDKVTVTELVKVAGVKRQTFYYHFKDLYSLLEWVYITDGDKIIGEKRTIQSWQEGLLNICQYIQANEKFVTHTYYSVNHTYLEDFLYHRAYELIRPVIDENAARKYSTEEEKEMLANFYKYAFVGYIIDWMSRGLNEPAEEIVYKITHSMRMISSGV